MMQAAGHRLRDGAWFAAAGALSRWMLVDVETRMHVAAFVVLAAVYGWMTPRSGAVGFAINATLAALAVVAVRWRIEGLCPGVVVPGCLPGR